MSEQKSPNGIFCRNELVTRDRAGAKKFYTGLLGWNTDESDMPGMPYTVFKAGEKQAGGMMEMPPDVPKEVPEVGRFCIIQDPTAVVVSLITMAG